MFVTMAWPDSVCVSPGSKASGGCPVAVVLPSMTWLVIGVTAHIHTAHNRLIILSPCTYSSHSCFGPHRPIRVLRFKDIPVSSPPPPPPFSCPLDNTIQMNIFCLDLISCDCEVMKYLLFGSAELCFFKVSGALTVSQGGKTGSRVAGVKASNDKSEAFEWMSGLKVHKEKQVFIVSDDQIRWCTLLLSVHAMLCSWFLVQVASEKVKHRNNLTSIWQVW